MTTEAFVLRQADEPLLEKIPERFVQPLRLAHTGIGYKSVAEQLNIPLNTAKTRVHRARQKLLHLRKTVQNKTAQS